MALKGMLPLAKSLKTQTGLQIKSMICNINMTSSWTHGNLKK